MQCLGQAFDSMVTNLSLKELTMLDNIQYFHEASDQAHIVKPTSLPGGVLTLEEQEMLLRDTEDPDGDYPMREAWEQQTFTDVDIAIAETLRYPAREVEFGAAVMDVAYMAGVFRDEVVHTALSSVANVADAEDIVQFWEWNKQLKSIMRSQEKEHGSGLTDQRHITLPMMLSSEPGSSWDVPKDPSNKERPLLGMLNPKQRRAHDIVENHLKALLAGAKPSSSIYAVQGQGGHWKKLFSSMPYQKRLTTMVWKTSWRRPLHLVLLPVSLVVRLCIHSVEFLSIQGRRTTGTCEAARRSWRRGKGTLQGKSTLK